ncbi:hypothetical protein BJ973_003994 [Actinoplanes tereljensis]|uniref:Putative restriction endonuclease domain-containing protein n=1 Tax=Paractinoplanes tereljensis TaxID=571912 RepID=A0A919TZB3_9ACTN|nr:Uma2 family endonuclease [Actinoplanes tereljensis]GIF25717.1 hypothetical protein Ate02nite_84470 [Actinoplanes tereljensis]
MDLDALAAMAAADETHRYELSADGALSIMPAGDPERALTVSRLVCWLMDQGLSPEQVVISCAIKVAAGARVPDVTVWAKGKPPRSVQSGYAATDGLLQIVEVVAPGTEAFDQVARRGEYAAAGILRYWIVEEDGTVLRHALDVRGRQYVPDPAGPLPLADLLSSGPDAFDDVVGV